MPGLKPEDALRAAMQVPPPVKAKKKARRPKRKA
jgi:hypothetical protein